MYVSTFDRDLLTSEVSLAKVLRRILAVGRRTSDVYLVPPKCLMMSQSADVSHAGHLLQYLAEIGQFNGAYMILFMLLALIYSFTLWSIKNMPLLFFE